MCPKILYDRKDCEGHFVCTAMDPERWTEADDNKADLKGGNKVRDGLYERSIDEAAAADAEDAATGCPADVIQVVGDDGDVRAGPEKRPIGS